MDAVGSLAGSDDRAVPAGDPPRDGVWAPARRRLTLGLVLTVTLVAFESLAISTVMPVVSDDLGQLGLYGWVFSGFFLGNLLGVVWAGQVADRRGTRAPFAVGLVLISGGLLVGGLAWSMPVLVAARVAQGLGAGVIPAVAYTSAGRSYPAEMRPRLLAVFSSAWVIPGVVGPAVSSALADVLGWRAVFLSILPLVVLAGAMTLPAMEPVPPVATTSADRRGWALVLVGAVTLVLVAVGGVPPGVALVLAGVGVPVAVWAFVRLVPAGTVRLAPGMPAAVMVRGLLTFAFFGTDAFVPLAYSDVRDQPTWIAGLALTAATVLWTAGAWVQQRLVLTVGPRRLVSVGFVLIVVGIGGMHGALGPLPVWGSMAVWGLSGLGMGLAFAPVTMTVLGFAPAGQEGAASASLQLSDVLGVALGTGLSGAFVALSESRGWELASALHLAFLVTAGMAVLGALAARRLPTALPN
ncbi:MAG: MFS transporter [Acidimicrobiia bacterium]